MPLLTLHYVFANSSILCFNLSISAWKLFSESMIVNVEDVHFILGPRTSHLSENEVSSVEVLGNNLDMPLF